MNIVIGNIEFSINKCNGFCVDDCEGEGYRALIKNLDTHRVTSGDHISEEEFGYLLEHILETTQVVVK